MMRALLLFPRGIEMEGGMNCQEFREILVDLAGDRLLDAAVRREAFAHVGVCAACAQRLEAERTLTARITEFSRATENLHASVEIKQQLRSAVAGLQGGRTATAEIGAKVAPVLPFAPVRRLS